MKNIKLKDLQLVNKEIIKEELVKQEHWTPKFLGMKKEDIYEIKEEENYLCGYDKDGLQVYYESSNGYWTKREYKDGLEVYYEDSDGLQIYYKNSNGFWSKIEDGKTIEFEDGKYYIDGEEAELKNNLLK